MPSLLSQSQSSFLRVLGDRASDRFRPVIVVVAAAAMSLVLLAPPAADAAPASESYADSATMRFDGAVNLLGLLNSLAVSPSEVRVRAGGVVTFVNDSGASLNLAVAGRTSTLPSGGSQRYDFPGGSRPQSFTASVTPVNTVVVDDALRSSGTVRVAAASHGGSPAVSSPRPSPSAVSGSTPDGAQSDAANKAAQASPAAPSHTSQANKELSTLLEWEFGDAPTVDRLLEPEVRQRAAQPDADEAAADEAAAPEGALSAFTDDGQVGLLIVVAAVLLIGVTAAAMRVVRARRRTVLRG